MSCSLTLIHFSSRVCMGHTLHNPQSFQSKKRKGMRISPPLLPILNSLSAQNFGLSLQTNSPFHNANWIGHPLIKQELMEAIIEQDGQVFHSLFLLCVWLTSAANHYPLRVKICWDALIHALLPRWRNHEQEEEQNDLKKMRCRKHTSPRAYL